MKKWLVFILCSSFVYGQIQEPVIWETSITSDTIKNIYTVTLKANIETGNTGLTVGSSVPFSDSSGTLTLTNVDAIDATTESTLEAAIDSLSNLTVVGTIGSGTWQGTAVGTAYGGTGLTSHGSSGQIMVSTGSGFQMQNIDGGTYS